MKTKYFSLWLTLKGRLKYRILVTQKQWGEPCHPMTPGFPENAKLTKLSEQYLLWKHVNTDWVLLSLCPEFNLSQDLIGEWIAHNKGRMTHSTSKVHKTPLSKQNDMTAIGQFITVNLKSTFIPTIFATTMFVKKKKEYCCCCKWLKTEISASQHTSASVVISNHAKGDFIH